ncbi:MAG: Fur family transcriptional regulator [Gammaproteobacteria bacterium]
MQTHSHTISAESLAAHLEAHGVLPTRQRLEIAAVLFARNQHLSADQVLAEVNRRTGQVSKATVYNTLNLFARQGLIREVIVDPAKVMYDTNTDDHHHFYNVDSGELIDIDADAFSISGAPKPPTGTVAEGVDIVVRVRNR